MSEKTYEKKDEPSRKTNSQKGTKMGTATVSMYDINQYKYEHTDYSWDYNQTAEDWFDMQDNYIPEAFDSSINPWDAGYDMAYIY